MPKTDFHSHHDLSVTNQGRSAKYQLVIDR